MDELREEREAGSRKSRRRRSRTRGPREERKKKRRKNERAGGWILLSWCARERVVHHRRRRKNEERGELSWRRIRLCGWAFSWSVRAKRERGSVFRSVWRLGRESLLFEIVISSDVEKYANSVIFFYLFFLLDYLLNVQLMYNNQLTYIWQLV